ncbi:MAG: hypothetical protein KGI98_15620 [Euryarchaeota archaeon]|nr:hypothetical protein [Euryarchaeota archaeon]
MTDSDPRDITERLTEDERALLEAQRKATPLPFTAIERRSVTLDEAIKEWSAVVAGNAQRAARSRSDRKHAVLQRRYFWTLTALREAASTIAHLRGERDEAIVAARR